jgi:hypothetical protein
MALGRNRRGRAWTTLAFWLGTMSTQSTYLLTHSRPLWSVSPRKENVYFEKGDRMWVTYIYRLFVSPDPRTQFLQRHKIKSLRSCTQCMDSCFDLRCCHSETAPCCYRKTWNKKILHQHLDPVGRAWRQVFEPLVHNQLYQLARFEMGGYPDSKCYQARVVERNSEPL